MEWEKIDEWDETLPIYRKNILRLPFSDDGDYLLRAVILPSHSPEYLSWKDGDKIKWNFSIEDIMQEELFYWGEGEHDTPEEAMEAFEKAWIIEKGKIV